HTGGEIVVLDLANMPGTGANLLPQLNQYGFLDFICEDDTAIDYLSLDIVSCCCRPDKIVECGSDWTFESPAVTDACCGDQVTVVLLGTVTNGTCPQVISQTWQATDCCGNTATCISRVIVVDTTPPVVACPRGKTIECGARVIFDEPTAYDTCCTNVTIVVIGDVAINTGQSPCVEQFRRTWRISDCCGNSTNCSQTITVTDTKPPVFATVCVTNHYEAGTTDDNFAGPEIGRAHV